MFEPSIAADNPSFLNEYTIEQEQVYFLKGLEPTAPLTSHYRFEEEMDDDDEDYDQNYSVNSSLFLNMFQQPPPIRPDRTNHRINPTSWPDVNVNNEPLKIKTLKEKLLDLYLNETKNSDKKFNYTTNLLEKLLRREEDYNTVVLNLYHLEKGFTLGFNIKKWANIGPGGLEVVHELNSTETRPVSYEENELLYYVNSGEIPPIVIDLIDHINVQLFYDGCIILEIRDHRRRHGDADDDHHTAQMLPTDTRFVLLQPSMQTLIADLNSITNDSHFIWTQEDKYSLESQLLLATSQPLCLTPDPRVLMLRSQALVQSSRSSPIRFDRRLKRFSQRYTESYRLKAKRWSQYSLPYPFRLLKSNSSNAARLARGNKWTDDDDQFISLLVDNKPLASWNDRENHRQLNEKFNSFHCIDSWSNKPSFTDIKLPREDLLMVKRLSSFNSERMKFSNDPNMYPIEEIVLEAADKTSKNNYSKLLIKRRACDGVYFCQLSLRPNNRTSTPSDINDVVFQLGLVSDAEKYVQQYVKIFTEEGRRSVNIMHNLLDKNKSNNKPGSNTSSVASIFSTIRKPNDVSLVSHGVMFQSLFSKTTTNNQELTDKQVLMYQAFLQNEHQQKILKQQQQQQAILKEANTVNNIESSASVTTPATTPTTPIYSPSNPNFRSPTVSSPLASSTQTNPPPQFVNNNNSPLRSYVNIQPARNGSQESPIKPNGDVIMNQSMTRTLSQHGKSPLSNTTQLATTNTGSIAHSDASQSSASHVNSSGSANSSLIQIYVPKLVNSEVNGHHTSSNNVVVVQSSPNQAATSSQQQPKARKTSTPRAKNTKANEAGDETGPKPKRQAKKKAVSTADLKQSSPLNGATSIVSNGVNGHHHNQITAHSSVKAQQQPSIMMQHNQQILNHSSSMGTHHMPATNSSGTKIINASSLFRKLATVDNGTNNHRSMPLIVTLNSGSNAANSDNNTVTYYNHHMEGGKPNQQQELYSNGSTGSKPVFQHSVSPMKQIGHESISTLVHHPSNGLVKQQQTVNNYVISGQQPQQNSSNKANMYNGYTYTSVQPQQQQQPHQSLIIVKPVNSNGAVFNGHNHPNSGANNNTNQLHFHGQLSK